MTTTSDNQQTIDVHSLFTQDAVAKKTDRLLLDIGMLPYANARELSILTAAGSEWSIQVDSRSLIDDGFVTFISHIKETDKKPSRRLFITAKCILEISQLSGHSVETLLENIPCSNEYQRILTRRIELLSTAYSLACSFALARGSSAVPVDVFFPRTGPIDAYIKTSDSLLFGVMRVGCAVTPRNAHKRFWALNKYNLSPPLLFVTAHNEIERDRIIEDLHSMQKTLWVVACEGDAVSDDPSHSCWLLPKDTSSAISMENIARYVSPSAQASTYPLSRQNPVRESLPKQFKWFEPYGMKKTILDTISQWPFSTADEVAALTRSEVRAARRNINDLTQQELIVEIPSSERETRFVLSNDGWRYLSYRDRTDIGYNIKRWGVSKTGDARGTMLRKLLTEYEHTTGINALAQKIAQETGDTFDISSHINSRIAYFTRNGEMRSVFPDIVFRCPEDGEETTYMIEYELRARSNNMILKKLSPWAGYFSYLERRNQTERNRALILNDESFTHKEAPVVLFVLKDPARVEKFRTIARRHLIKSDVGHHTIFITSLNELMNEHTRVKSEIWQSTDDRYHQRFNPFSEQSRMKLSNLYTLTS